VISRRDLVRALGRRKVSDWVVAEHAQELALADEVRGLDRREARTRTTLTVHQDVPKGRGTARLELTAQDGSAADVVDQAVSLALTAVAPSWKSVAPAAPAKVTVLDPALASADLAGAAAQVLQRLRRPAGATVAASIEVLREQVTVQSSAGLVARWTASHLHAEALVTAGERSLALARDARRAADLALDRAIAGAAVDLAFLAAAGPPAPGPCALVLTADAMLHGEDLGVWAPFAAQADAALAHRGLTRYQPGAPVAPGADRVDEPLGIASHGALDHATRSAPVGDEGDAIRRFTLVERGVCTNLGLSPREAARRGRDPNGGVRNLVIAPGTWDEAVPEALASRAPRTIEVRRLQSLAIDPYTGEASLEIALAIEHAGGARRPLAGGTVYLDLVAALARARRGAARIRRGPYVGPAAVLIEDAELI
jgi:predicted Zn-dependent protease